MRGKLLLVVYLTPMLQDDVYNVVSKDVGPTVTFFPRAFRSDIFSLEIKGQKSDLVEGHQGEFQNPVILASEQNALFQPMPPQTLAPLWTAQRNGN